MAGRRRQSAVTRNQSRAEFFGKRDVGRIIRRQIVAELPNARQQNVVGIAGHTQVEQVLDGPFSKVRWDCSIPDQASQYLGDFEIQQVRSVQGFVTREYSLLDPLPRGCLKQPVNGGRCVEDDQSITANRVLPAPGGQYRSGGRQASADACARVTRSKSVARRLL